MSRCSHCVSAVAVARTAESGSSERKSDGILSTSHPLRAESLRELSSAIPRVPVIDVDLVASLENVSTHENPENLDERP